ncbi:MAG: hypothetical protein SNH73_00015 [Rikenellaceae bacterium]
MRIFLYSLLLVVTTALVGCDETINNDIEWDVAPLNINMYVQDNQGNDLLSPSAANNIIDDNIYIEYQDSTYYLNAQFEEASTEITFDSSTPNTRAYRAVLTGITIAKYGNDYVLVFGEFDGAKDWNDSFEIYWGDGTKDTISFERDFEWDKDGSPTVVSSALYLNNMKMDELIIVK